MSSPLALIIEDDGDLNVIFAHALQLAAFETEVIGDGTTGVERLKQVVPDLVVLDLHLPGLSGIDVLRQIRADERLRKTRVFMSTADPRMAATLQDEVDLVLVKPVSFRQLRDLATRFYAETLAAANQDGRTAQGG